MTAHASTPDPGDRYGLWNAVRGVSVSLLVFFVAGAVLVWLSPLRGTVHSGEFLPGALALRTAGGNPIFVFFAAGVDIARVYLTAIPTALLVVGIGLCSFGRDRVRLTGLGVCCSVLAAAAMPTLSGCACGTGSTTPLWRAAAWTIANDPAWSQFLGSIVF